MAALSIRSLSQAAHDALRQRAAQNRRSIEAEARAMIEALAKPPTQTVDMDRLRKLQVRSVAAFGGPTAAAGESDRFLAERAADWDE